MITIFAPDGIGEVTAGHDLAAVVLDAVRADPQGPLADGDIVVVTSKIISKAEGRTVPAAGPGVDAHRRDGPHGGSPGRDRDRAQPAGADPGRRRRRQVQRRPAAVLAAARGSGRRPPPAAGRPAAATGLRLGVIISDTAGRAWRIGQTDHAIGAAGVLAVRSYAGESDGYGNRLEVTEMALADELAARPTWPRASSTAGRSR